MTEAEFAEIAAVCDSLLCASTATPERIAFSSLHVLSEHPVNLEPFERMYLRPRAIATEAQRVREILSTARTLCRSLGARAREFMLAGAQRYCDRVDVLLVSHLVSTRADSDAGADFYYGDLASELASRGLTSLVVQHDHVGVTPGYRKPFSAGREVARLVLPRWHRFSEELWNIRRIKRAARNLQDELKLEMPRVNVIAKEAARHALRPPTLVALRTQTAVELLCRRFRPRLIVTTWEGHPWERLALHGARKAIPDIRCAAYQHTILLPRSHALRRTLGRQYDPDVVLTVGDVNREILATSPGLSRIPVLTYGSHRRFAGMPARAADAPTRCLVIPEGLESECVRLCDFAIAAALTMPNLRFVVRMHPVLPFDKLARHHSRFRTLPRNVQVSGELDIIGDFAKCNWAIYRGSSAVTHAVLAGVRPIYLEKPGEMPIDPLFALTRWRRKVADTESFKQVVEDDLRAAPEERWREWDPARSFCDRYVMPANPQVVADLLQH
jgi:hypothetical protein